MPSIGELALQPHPAHARLTDAKLPRAAFQLVDGQQQARLPGRHARARHHAQPREAAGWCRATCAALVCRLDRRGRKQLAAAEFNCSIQHGGKHAGGGGAQQQGDELLHSEAAPGLGDGVGAGPRQPSLQRLQHQLLPGEERDAEEGVHGAWLALHTGGRQAPGARRR